MTDGPEGAPDGARVGVGAPEETTPSGVTKAVRTPRWIDDDDDDDRTTLTRWRIVAAALDVVDQEGLAGLTMRRLAGHLGVAPMSLYTHVAGKRELIDLMVDHVIGEVREQVVTTGTWQEQLRSIVRSFHTCWARHGTFIAVYSAGIRLGPNAVRLSEWLVQVLRDAGFTDRDAAYALYSLVEYVVGTLQFSPVQTAVGALPEADGQFHSRVSEYFVAVEVEEIPNIVAVDEHLNGDSFEFGLDLLVDGLEARLARTRAAAVVATTPGAPGRGRRPAAPPRGDAVVRPARH